MTLRGDLWCLRRAYGAMQEMRDPRAYLETPVRVRAPRSTPPFQGVGGDATAAPL